MPIYLDNSATTRVCEEAAQKVLDVMLNHYGNPSSLHSMGLDAELIVTGARENIAAALHCKPSEIIFTSCGTEANNLAIFSAANTLRRRGNRIVTTKLEHPSVQNVMHELEKSGFEVVYLSPDANGFIKADELAAAITPDTILVSMMLVNNETGAIQPVEAIKKAVLKAHSPALIHCDAVQAFCKIPLRPDKLGVDLLTISSHKIHGPKGAGALYVRNGVRLLPMLFGGGQEKGIRSGTESVPAIAGFGKAAQIAFEKLDETSRLTRSLRDYCIEQFKEMPYVVINAPALALALAVSSLDMYAPHIMNISVLGIRSETMLHYLESEDIYVSSGSACSKGAKSHVLAAMSLPDKNIDSALRISFSRFNTLDEAKILIEAVSRGAARLIRKSY
jgi:cysteine desulfurase